MPANLPPQYYELEREFRAERDSSEQLRMAQELLKMMPKHKGTDKLQAEMKAKISKLRKLIAGGGVKHGARQVATFDHVEKEGARQIILIGPPNSGKSSLVDALTHAKPPVADYPYTTREPLTGMMTFETVQIQLIDTPPISTELYENYMSGLIRNADMVLLVADLAAASMLDDLKYLLGKLEEKRILLKSEFVENPEDSRYANKKTVICGHKEYEDESGQAYGRLKDAFGEYAIVPTSIIDDDSLDALRKCIFDNLNIIRVYTKTIGHDPSFKDPIIIPVGGTVEQAARDLHKDFASNLKFAKVWGEGKYDGQRVQRDFVLTDKDIVEFHL